jgi:hypothetical protein
MYNLLALLHYTTRHDTSTRFCSHIHTQNTYKKDQVRRTHTCRIFGNCKSHNMWRRTAIFRKCANCRKDLYRTAHCKGKCSCWPLRARWGVRAQGDRWIGQLPPFLRVRVIISLRVKMNFSQAHESHVLSTIVEEEGSRREEGKTQRR